MSLWKRPSGPPAEAPIADGQLEALLTSFAVTAPGVFLYHPGRRQVMPKLRAFIDHVKNNLGATIETKTNGGRELNRTV